MNDFDVLKIMSDKNMDISASTELVSIDKDRRGGTIKMGIAGPIFEKVIANIGADTGKYVPILYIINMEEFNAIKKNQS